MSAATSPGTGLAYGLRRVCAAWGMARSSFYAMTSGQHAEQPPAKRRGPKPAISDQALLVAIEADLEASPWEGEGYRKVWARLRVCRDIRVARKRVLRLMRENNLLSPHRCRRRGGNPHDGEIITHAPNLVCHAARQPENVLQGRRPCGIIWPHAAPAERRAQRRVVDRNDCVKAAIYRGLCSAMADLYVMPRDNRRTSSRARRLGIIWPHAAPAERRAQRRVVDRNDCVKAAIEVSVADNVLVAGNVYGGSPGHGAPPSCQCLPHQN